MLEAVCLEDMQYSVGVSGVALSAQHSNSVVAKQLQKNNVHKSVPHSRQRVISFLEAISFCGAGS